MSIQTMGYARRNNGSCPETEANCQHTARDQFACCPLGLGCVKGRGDNTVCCPPNSGDCTNELDRQPRCADTAWRMYNNSEPFCCEKTSLSAFDTNGKADVCADVGYQTQEGDHLLGTIPQDLDGGSCCDTLRIINPSVHR